MRFYPVENNTGFHFLRQPVIESYSFLDRFKGAG